MWRLRASPTASLYFLHNKEAKLKISKNFVYQIQQFPYFKDSNIYYNNNPHLLQYNNKYKKFKVYFLE